MAPAAASATSTNTNFRLATQPTIGPFGSNTQTLTISTATQPLAVILLPPSNIMRGIAVEVSAVVPSNNSATVAFNADAPQNIFSTFNFATSGGTPIVGSFDSYTAATVQKYGGYARNADIKNSAVYTAVTGSGATGGNFTEVFRIPVEVVNRSGYGSLSNTSTESPLQLALTLNTSTAVYSTAPTALPVVTVKTTVLGYWAGPSGRATPQNFGSTQYWNQQTYNALNGAQTYVLQAPPGMGNKHRNWVAINRTASSSARSSSNFPSPLTLNFRGQVLYNVDNTLWVDEMSRVFGYNAALDTANGLDTGVFVIPFDVDLTFLAGSESGAGYLDTANGDPIQFNGTWNASCNLYWLVNFINNVGA